MATRNDALTPVPIILFSAVAIVSVALLINFRGSFDSFVDWQMSSPRWLRAAMADDRRGVEFTMRAALLFGAIIGVLPLAFWIASLLF